MNKLLSPKLLIPLLVMLLLVGMTLYILFAPATWWKPLYIRIEGDSTSTPQTVAEAPMQPTQPAVMPAVNHLTAFQPDWGLIYALDTKVVNLAEPGGLRYLQTAIALEIRPANPNYYFLEGEERDVLEEELIAEIDQRRPRIDDIVMTTLSSKAFSEIATIEGKQTLKQELTTAINEALGYEAIMNVYFTDFVVQ